MAAGLSTQRLRVGLIGAGAFGGFHANKLAAAVDARFIGISDIDFARASALAAKHGVDAFSDHRTLIAACDAVVIASPASTHAAIAADSLRAGLHVLVEKPLAATAEDARRLVEMADARGLVLQTGHQERFVIDALGLTEAPERPSFVFAARESTPSPRGCDVSVTLDLMIHDLDLVATLFGAEPRRIDAWGEGEDGRYDLVEATLTFETGQARLRASRIADERRRVMRVEYPSGIAEIDFVSRTVRAPAALGLDAAFAAKAPDPLGQSVAAFLKACAAGRLGTLSGEAGAAAVKLACAIDTACARRAKAAA